MWLSHQKELPVPVSAGLSFNMMDVHASLKRMAAFEEATSELNVSFDRIDLSEDEILSVVITDFTALDSDEAGADDGEEDGDDE
jgi:hypothetical protein